MKGISLAIETVVILIIAVVILGILSYMLISGTLPGVNNLKLQQNIQQYCGLYVQLDPTCANTKNQITTFGDSAATLAGFCKTIGYSSCTGTPLTITCVKQCCAAMCTK